MASDKTDSGKKRKRNADGSTKPSKKVAIDSARPISNVTISLVQDTDSWAPIVVSTPGLAVKDSITLQPYTKRRKSESSRSAQSGPITTNELLLQSSEHPTIDYLGKEEEAGGTDSLLKHYVGVFDPATGKLQVMEARKMTIRGIVRARQAAPEAMEESSKSHNMRDLRNDLGQTFGTKKARKAIASLTENAISHNRPIVIPGNTKPIKHDSATEAMLALMAATTENMASRDELQAVADEAKPRPKANLAAETPAEVYTIDDLVGSEIMKVVPVSDWLATVKSKQEVITKSKYVSSRIQQASADVTKLKVLRYLLSLLEFFLATQPRRGGRMLPKKREDLRAAVAGVPETILEHIRRQFSERGEMSKFKTDLLITHVCALALIVDNFEVDTYDLREDLQLEPKQIQTYFKEIGARITAPGEAERRRLDLDKAAAAQHMFAKLKLPLQFPKVSFTRAKK